MPVFGKQPETFHLRLDHQQFVERVLVIQRNRKFAGGMAHRHRQERHVLVFQGGDDIFGREAALAFTRPVAGIVLETHFPDGDGADVKIGSTCCQRLALSVPELAWPVHEVEQA